ncbi:MAG: SPFH domain-containing protein, partial [Planctomycetes bacterium]|nr:SPFH domain-containing protein [Planctomycetota bacterium]
MSKTLDNHRWLAPEGQFAVRILADEAPGFFAKKLIVEPGTRALIIDEGVFQGEMPPGSYTLESLPQRVKFWKTKQATVILTRQEDLPLDIACPRLATAEHLMVEASVRLSVQIEDVALFLRNLLGSRPGFSIDQLCDAIGPLVQQAMWEAVGRLSISDLTGPEVRGDLDAAVEQALGVSLKRYGLRFGQIQTVSVRHDRYDEHLQKQGEVWLIREGLQQQKALDELG